MIIDCHELRCNSRNDSLIDEGKFYFSKSDSEEIEKIIENKKKFKICCFLLEEVKLDKDLMWAHYGNGHCGVNIDFRVDVAHRDEVFKVRYRENPPKHNKQNPKDFAQYALTLKGLSFTYENEYRAIWNGGDKHLPIQIYAITLGKRFATEVISNYETENKEFDKNDNVVRIARQFLNIWESGERRGGKPPRFYAYKTQYSREPEPIPSCLLQEVESSN